ncbi:retrovirus-related Pol polyprotein from transposon TNT 1-94 [Senna tora]|uniref:Retrovirus-related Pol polyprotein from transposon TNT 1-94 n=1 Tax=Senna tora TaxID=362788 RepID=A0A834W119_9FABA|nr:retrovirus-related Pol polyprotein from transposon TNT 1-94 [Senna tora]
MDGRKGDEARGEGAKNDEGGGIPLVVSSFTGDNYLAWGLAVRIALEAKDKLGFVDGTFPEPTDAIKFRKWKKAYSMVKAWMTNSIAKNITDTLTRCRFAREVWLEVEVRFGASCGPQRYQLQQEVATTEQDHEENKLVQFLTGLSASFDVIRSQILNLEPAPSVNKAYAMITRVERQREETCFKLNGYPDWYRDLKDQKKKNSVVAGKKQMEMVKAWKSSKCTKERVNFASLHDFSGNVSSDTSLVNVEWIIDTGASSHMCSKLSITKNIRTLLKPIVVLLPNGEFITVRKKGEVFLSDKLQLTEVLYGPSFKYNLISVNKLIKWNNVIVSFDKDSCMIQDLMNKQVLASANARGSLYVLQNKDLGSKLVCKPGCSSIALNVHDNCNFWHSRLGHASLTVMKHIEMVNKDGDFHFPIKVVRSDNGTEFVNSNSASISHKRGILHHRSCNYTPQQNGIVERKHKHLLQKGYKVFDMVNKKIIVSRDVEFYENVFPYSKNSNNESDGFPKPILIYVTDDKDSSDPEPEPKAGDLHNDGDANE